MVIPVVGGGVMIALADLALALVLLTAGLLAIGVLHWALANARGRLGGLPLVGGAIVGAINIMMVFVQTNAYAMGYVLQLQLHFAIHSLRIVLNFFLAPVFMPLLALVQGLSNRIWDYDNNAFPRVQAQFTNMWDHVREYDFNVFPRIAATLVTLTNDVTLLGHGLLDVTLRTTGLASRVNDYDQNVFPRIQAGFNGLGTAVAELQGYLPLLRTLAEFETITVGGIQGLGVRVGELERAEADLFRDLAKVLPLSVIAALGAVAVRELADTATNPCRCLDTDTFTDLGDRVSALEIAVG